MFSTGKSRKQRNFHFSPESNGVLIILDFGCLYNNKGEKVVLFDVSCKY